METSKGLNHSPTDTATGATLAAHLADLANPHAVTKAQVGLGSADNTSDVNKPVSTAQQTALNLKAPTNIGKNISVITASGNFTTPANTDANTVFMFDIVGGGGGGGGCNNVAHAAAGGGGGERRRGKFTGLAAGTVIAITIGALGAGGASATVGANGGDTIIGVPVSVTAKGGLGGAPGAAASIGGLGGTAGGGAADLTIPGRRGDDGFTDGTTNYSGGQGGDSAFGNGGKPGHTGAGTPRSAADGYGAGGAAAVSTAGAGSNGSPGLVIITW